MYSVFTNITQPYKRGITILLLLVCIPIYSKGADPFETDTLQHTTTTSIKKDNAFKKVVKFVNGLLEQDTTYVAPDRYNFAIMPQYRFGYEYYRFATKDGEQSITISPTSNNRLGLFFGWRRLLIGYSFTLDKIQPDFDMELNLYASRVGLELFYRKRSDGFKIRNVKGFYDENEQPLKDYNTDFNGLKTAQIGANLFYIFNYKKFSFPAAFRRSTNQLRNAGSLILGLSYNERKFMFDHTKIDPQIEQLMKPELRFKVVDYKEISINCGYSYNWVFAKHFLANMSVSPAIAYKNTLLMSNKNKSKEFSSFNIDFISRLALVYNNGRYYAGTALVSHTYSYNQSSLSVNNGFGHIKVYAGFNFWQRK